MNLHLNSRRWWLAAVLAAPVVAVAAEPAVLLSGADLYTVSHGVIPAGEILIVGNDIVAVGRQVEAPPDARRIDLTGKRVYPGLIAAHTIIGLTEMPIVNSTNDFAELGTNNAHLQVQLALKADTRSWPVARAAGVLTALVVPRTQAGGLVSGQSALTRGIGRTSEAQVIQGRVGMHVAWPATHVTGDADIDAKQRVARDEQLKALADIFRDARAYRDAAPGRSGVRGNPSLEALQPVLEGKQRLFVHADGIVPIRQALAFAQRERIDMVLVGGADAWRLADALREQKVPVILGSSHRLPARRWESNHTAYAAAGRLLAAGVQVAIANDVYASSLDERNLAHRAASYAAHGLSADAALRAITLSPAEILGVDARLGSLDAGKRATLFISDGDVLDVRTRVESAWIDGRQIDLENHQKRLRREYTVEPSAAQR